MTLSKMWNDFYTELDLRDEEILIVNSHLNTVKAND